MPQGDLLGDTLDEIIPPPTDEPSSDPETFPDPDLDTEPPDSDEEAGPPAEGGSAVLPASDLPTPTPTPIPVPPPPPTDQGFTPYTPPRAESAPVPPQPDVKFFSAAQLRQGVNEGLITEDQMVEQLQLQAQTVAIREAKRAVEEQTRTQQITAQLNQYRALVPGWDQPGSPANQQATPAFERLLALGQPNNDLTRLLALEQTFGTAQRIQESRNAQTRTAELRATPQGIGRRGPPPSSQTKKDPVTLLPIEEQREYKRLIKEKVYKDWNEVRAELKGAASRS